MEKTVNLNSWHFKIVKEFGDIPHDWDAEGRWMPVPMTSCEYKGKVGAAILKMLAISGFSLTVFWFIARCIISVLMWGALSMYYGVTIQPDDFAVGVLMLTIIGGIVGAFLGIAGLFISGASAAKQAVNESEYSLIKSLREKFCHKIVFTK